MNLLSIFRQAPCLMAIALMVPATVMSASNQESASKYGAAISSKGGPTVPPRTLHWYDGNRKAIVYAPADTFVAGKDAQTATAPKDQVYLDAYGGKRQLPGGVLVHVKDSLSAGELTERLKAFEVQSSTPLGTDGRTWLIATEAGLDSLELANAIHESGLVSWATPNWRREVSKK